MPKHTSTSYDLIYCLFKCVGTVLGSSLCTFTFVSYYYLIFLQLWATWIFKWTFFFLMVFSLSVLFVGALSSGSCSFLPQFGFTQDLNASSLCGRWFQIGEWRREAAKRDTVECNYGPLLLETFGIHVNTPPSYPHGRARKLRYLSPSHGGWGLLPGALTLLQLAHAQVKLASIARKNLQARGHKGS